MTKKATANLPEDLWIPNIVSPKRGLIGPKTGSNRTQNTAKKLCDFCFFLIFKCFNLKRFAQSAGPGFQRVHFWSSFSLGSEKGRLLALIFSLGALFGAIFGSCLVHFWVILAHFSFLGALWERWGPTFLLQKRFEPPKAPPEAFPRTSSHFFGHIWESCFEYFSIFGALFLSFVFC